MQTNMEKNRRRACQAEKGARLSKGRRLRVGALFVAWTKWRGRMSSARTGGDKMFKAPIISIIVLPITATCAPCPGEHYDVRCSSV